MRIFLAVLVIAIVGTVGWLYLQPEGPARQNTTANILVPSENVSKPTNFNEVGILHFPAPESGQAEGTFEYDDGVEMKTLRITMDGLSICSASSVGGGGAVPCIAMSITFDKPFDGKTALMEGIRSGNTILVRKMRVAAEGEELRSFEPGSIFVSWAAALELFRACEVTLATQTHALDVYLNLTNGSRVRAVEPTIDEMFRVISETSERCGAFPVGTE